MLCAEHLGRHFNFMSTMKNSGIEIKITKDSPTICYLMFPDDCSIFSRSIKWAALGIKNILGHYTKVFGQLVNYHKSKVQSMKGVPKQVHKDFTNIFYVIFRTHLEARIYMIGT